MSLAAQSVIGSILIDAACLPVVRPLVTAQDFPLAADRAIFEATCRLADAGKPADVLTILEDARKHGADVSDRYAAELLQVTPTAAHAAEYARQVHEEAVRRRLTAVGETLLEDAQDQQKPTAGVISLDTPPAGTDEDVMLRDIIPDAAAELAFEDVEHKDLCSAVQSVVLSLPEDQRTAIIREFWYGQKPDPKTRSKAMKSLRRPSVSRALRTYY